MNRRRDAFLDSFCAQCQAAACIHVVEALKDAGAHVEQQKTRFAAMAALMEPRKEVTE
jgi:hypothetical protein